MIFREPRTNKRPATLVAVRNPRVSAEMEHSTTLHSLPEPFGTESTAVGRLTPHDRVLTCMSHVFCPMLLSNVFRSWLSLLLIALARRRRIESPLVLSGTPLAARKLLTPMRGAHWSYSDVWLAEETPRGRSFQDR